MPRVRRYVPSDEGFFKGLVSDPAVMANMDGPLSPERAAAIWAGLFDEADPRCGRVMVDEADRPVAHLAWYPAEGGATEILFIVHPEHRGRGLATFGARWLVAQLEGPLVASVDVVHAASRRVLEKAGFVLEAEFPEPEDGGPPWCRYRRE